MTRKRAKKILEEWLMAQYDMLGEIKLPNQDCIVNNAVLKKRVFETWTFRGLLKKAYGL